VNMAWMWARFHARTTKLATFEGGFQNFADSFAAELKKRGVIIHFSTGVNNIQSNSEGGLTLTTGNYSLEFNRCVVTVSPALMARMTPDLPKDYLQG
jgi:phytoene dehydrogenase-like protein